VQWPSPPTVGGVLLWGLLDPALPPPQVVSLIFSQVGPYGLSLIDDPTQGEGRLGAGGLANAPEHPHWQLTGNPSLPTPGGPCVDGVQPGSAAATLGVAVGMRLLRVAGEVHIRQYQPGCKSLF
jgi:hypothetical protein